MSDKPPDDLDPPIREFADRGTIWLLESPNNLRDLIRLIADELAERLDFTRAERVNRSFVPADLYKEEADIVYRVPFLTGDGSVWIYLLMEHQSQPEMDVGLKLLAAMVELWQTQVRHWQDARTPARQRRLYPVLPVVFYTGARRWKIPLSVSALMDLPSALEEFVPSHRTLFLSLKDTPADSLRQAGGALAQVLSVLQKAEAPHKELEAVIARAVRFLESLPATEEPEWRRALHFILLLIRHKRPPEERSALFELVERSVQSWHKEEVESMVMTDAQVLRKEGSEEGREEERRELVRDLLLAKFDELPPNIEILLDRLTTMPNTRLTRQILAATKIEDL